MSRATRLVVTTLVLVAAGAGCSLIVSGDVPEFKCAGTDPSACPSGMTCDTTTSRCVTSEAGVEPIEASDEDAPDEDVVDAGKDVDAGPRDLGSQCRVDSECKSKLCGSSTILTTTITMNTGPICTTPCCNSNECAPSFVCFNGGTGGGYCVPADLAKRQPPVSGAGGKGAGTLCVANPECRSGLCTGSPKRCLDTCCTDAQCATGNVCRLAEVSAPGPVHTIWVCAPAAGPASHGDTCVNQSDCKSDTCLPSSGGYCRPACSGHASCAASGFVGGLCRYNSSGNDFFKACQKTTPAGIANGQPCNNDVECESDYCDPELAKCANVCSTGADCTSAEMCRPSGTGTPFLRCVKKP